MKKLVSVLFIVLALGVSLNAQTSGQMRIGGQVGIAIPMGGDISDAYSTGFNINGLFIYHLQPQIDLTGHIGYMRLGAKESGVDAHFSTVPFLVGARYNFPTSSSFAPYAGAELGLFFSSSSATISYDFGYFGSGSQTVSASSTDFGFVPAAGFTYPLTPSLLLDVNAKFNIIAASGAGTIFGINAGVTYGL